MRGPPRLVVVAACVALVLAFASLAFATGSSKPVWAGHDFNPEHRQVHITSAENSASSFSFTWWVFGFTPHEPEKGIDWIRFGINADPTEIKNLTVVPAPGWFWVGPYTVARDHVWATSGTTPFLNVHFGITGTETMQNTTTADFFTDPVTVHFAYYSEIYPYGFSTTTVQQTMFYGIGVDHHGNNPVEDHSWGWIKSLFK